MIQDMRLRKPALRLGLVGCREGTWEGDAGSRYKRGGLWGYEEMVISDYHRVSSRL